MSDSKQNRIYFYGLDEIRAIAALLVYFHHVELFKKRESHPSLYEFKYTGNFISNIGHNSVICFFVLSGFLITYLLLKEKEKIGTVKIREFYIRRILRIWPLYFFVTFIGFVLLPVLGKLFNFQGQAYYPSLIEKIDYNALPMYLLFLSNIALLFYKPIAGAAQSWSVSVEEQFYLIWPNIVKFSKGVKQAFIFILILFLIKIGANYFSYSIFGKQSIIPAILSKVSIEYMCVGAFGAFVIFSEKLRAPASIFLKNKLALVGILILIILECVKYNHTLALAFLFILLILMLVTQEIKIKFLKPFGKISYGIYMLHPLCIFISFSIASQFKTEVMFNLVLYSLSFVLTILISMASYKYLEMPFLKRKEKFAIIQSGSV
ncbi:MAG: acyltransferase [Bacteroidota bacterium]|nr:acyltransferase [Bacteroidota bacterium]